MFPRYRSRVSNAKGNACARNYGEVTAKQIDQEVRKLLDDALCGITGTGALNPLFLRMDNAPDFIQDRGHTYGAGLSDGDKLALIEYVKMF